MTVEGDKVAYNPLNYITCHKGISLNYSIFINALTLCSYYEYTFDGLIET